ncbi:MAG: 30S ribosomal protein S12 methylthiotransferase RimO [Spirochaetia bacterium]|nr:30S ribosomal protein S12 methylthiotransferase RimO [Spirochaetia bacterium]MBQ6674428.1 30S ribosomal protein S12 methylthiotransferase RimO [Spirochaetia bacterium]MBQ6905152.1 30S ribosomal protein S12 methylthiotransferase RimO [Spirochaetia bacterium]
MKKTFYIVNLGCSKNQVDGETILALMEQRGWKYTDLESADVVIINTCGFINDAKEESINTILNCKSSYPDKIVIAAGCLAQRYGKELSDEMTEADGFVGNRDLYAIPEAVEKIVKGRTRLVSPASPSPDCFVERDVLFTFPRSTYIKIAEGCNNNCTYCAIPLIRGQLRSIDPDIIIKEIKSFIKKGFFEINLVSQDLASWGTDIGHDLVYLLKRICRLKGDFRIRLLYMHPDKFNPDILPLFKKDSRLIPYFDIPFQHASEPVLKAMGRKGNKEKYLKLISTIRKELPESVIRSTMMLGFPGEKENDFQCLMDFLKGAELDWCGFFTYSREEGTKAFDLKDKVPMATAGLRKEQAQDLQNRITEKRLESYIGNEIEVLVEELIAEEEIALGRGYMNAPEVDGAVILHSSRVENGGIKPGDVIRAKVIKRNNIDLEAADVGLS